MKISRVLNKESSFGKTAFGSLHIRNKPTITSKSSTFHLAKKNATFWQNQNKVRLRRKLESVLTSIWLLILISLWFIIIIKLFMLISQLVYRPLTNFIPQLVKRQSFGFCSDDDFKKQSKVQITNENAQEMIKSWVKNNDIVLFMKGTP